MRADHPLAAAFDLLCCLLMVFVILSLVQQKHTPPRIDTFGVYAVTISWPSTSDDDVDLYVEDPQGNIAFFNHPSAGLLQLERDDLGIVNDQAGGVTIRNNSERTIIRGTVPGEYIANVHLYRKYDPGPVTVTVELWKLRGSDRLVISRSVVLTHEGDEQTAFRFTFNRRGDVTSTNRLQRQIVRETR